MEKINQKKIQFLITILGLIIIYYFYINPTLLFNQTIFYNFQARDIDRAREILKGHLILYGPEMTGGGNLPGPLYYLTLGLGQLIDYTWKSAWIIEFVFIFIAGLFGFYYFHEQNKKSSAFIWLALFASAPLTAWFVKVFLNTSLLIPFVVYTLISSLNAFKKNHSKSIYLYYSAFLAIGLGIQYHFSIICFLPAILIANFLVYKKYSLKQNAIALSIFLLPSLPHLTWLFASKIGIHFGSPAFYSGDADQSIVSLIYLIKLNLNVTYLKLMVTWIKKLLITFPFITLPIILTSIFYRKNLSKNTKFYLIFLGCGFIPYLNWYFSGQAIRYTIPFYVTALIMVIDCLDTIFEDRNYLKIFNFLSIILLFFTSVYALVEFNNLELKQYIVENFIITFVIILLFAKKLYLEFKKTFSFVLSLILIFTLAYAQREFISSERAFNSKNQEGYMMSYEDWKYIFETVYKFTGNDFEHYKYQTYYIGHHVNQSPFLAMEGFKFDKKSILKNTISPDGFIISNRFGNLSMAKQKDKLNPYKWMLNQNIHYDLKMGLISGHIKLGENLSSDKLIIPYYVTNQFEFPQHFHNISAGYKISNEDLELEKIKNEGILKLSDNEILFKWNENPDQASFCSTGAKVKISEPEKNQYLINVRIIGATLSQITPWISPNWTQSWDEPFIEVNCNNQNMKFNLSESIGFNRKYSHRVTRTPFFAGNNSFAAPFERIIKVKCNKNIDSISIGRNGSTIDMITNTKTLPGKKLTYKFNE